MAVCPIRFGSIICIPCKILVQRRVEWKPGVSDRECNVVVCSIAISMLPFWMFAANVISIQQSCEHIEALYQDTNPELGGEMVVLYITSRPR